MAPKVSVIIPVYNVALYLSDCLDSIVNQTLVDIEIICVDDGSTDDSLSIVTSYANHDKRIKIITQENAGLGAARNVGVRASKSKYLLFVDSDDWIVLNAVEKLYEVAESKELDILQASYNYSLVKESDVSITYKDQVDLLVSSGREIGGNTYVLSPFNWDKLWKSEFFIDNNLYNIENIFYEDVLTSYKGFSVASRVAIVDFSFYNYRQRQGSIFNQTPSLLHVLSLKIVLEEMVKLLDDEGLWKNASFFKAVVRIVEKLRVDVSQHDHGEQCYQDIRKYVGNVVSKMKIEKRSHLKFDFIVFQVLYLPVSMWSFFHKIYFFMKALFIKNRF